MDNEQRTSRFQCKKHFVSINKNSNRFYTDILFLALCTGYKISIYLLILEHAYIHEIVEFTNDFEENNLPIVWFYSFVCNLKKILALVLAFACAFTMFASAAFTDQADIKVDSEVVDTLTALGVVEGFEDGSFQPNGTVTRAQMAKMIYVLRTGKSDASAYNDDKTSFTDINGHWARGYIKYCQSLGVIAGKSSTKFCPNEKVTAQEAAKMLLVTLGYDATKAGLVGSNWASKTNALADEAGLLKDVSTAFTAACPRQYAAQLIYNAIFAKTVVLRDGEYTKYGYDNTPNPTVGAKYMDLEEFTGIYTGDSNINTGLKDGQIMVGGKIATYVPANGNAWVGEAVKVLYKESKDGVDGLDKKDTVYGMYLTDDTSVVTGIMGDLDKCSDANKIKLDGTKYDTTATIDVYVNYVSDVPTTTGTGVATVTAATATTSAVYAYNCDAFDNGGKFYGDSADEIKFVKNENGKIFAAYITNVKFHKVTGLTSSKITLAGIGTLDIDDSMNLDSNVKKDDIVAVTTMYKADPKDDDAFNVIKKAEVVSGVKVASRRSATEPKVNDSYAKLAAARNVGTLDSDYLSANTVGGVDIKLKSTYDFVMYGDYFVAAKKVVASASEIALVTKASTTGLNDQVKVLLADGTEKVYDYDDDDVADRAYSNITSGVSHPGLNKLYSYTTVGSDKIQLESNEVFSGTTVAGLTFAAKTVDNTTGSTATKVYDKKTKVLTVTGATYATTDETVAFVKVGTKYYTYKADAIKDISSANVANTTIDVVLDGSDVVAFYIELGSKPGASTSDDKYGLIVSKISYDNSDNTNYCTFDVWNGSTVESVKVEASGLNTGVEKGAFIQYNVGSDGLTDKSDVKVLNKANLGAVKKYEASRKVLTVYDGTATIAAGANTATFSTTSTHALAINDDVQILYVDSSEPEGVESGSVLEATPDATGANVDANIMYVLNTDNEVVLIIADVDNKIEFSDNMPKTGSAVMPS